MLYKVALITFELLDEIVPCNQSHKSSSEHFPVKLSIFSIQQFWFCPLLAGAHYSMWLAVEVIPCHLNKFTAITFEPSFAAIKDNIEKSDLFH